MQNAIANNTKVILDLRKWQERRSDSIENNTKVLATLVDGQKAIEQRLARIER